MAKIWEINGFTLESLADAVSNGYVNVRYHPKYDLRIYNYSDKAQFTAGVWNDTVKACRGLIVDNDDNIVARPFPKFFNYSQPEAAQIPLDASVVVTDKLDGSLGIIYPTPDGDYAVATRGSFTSDQAIKGTEILKQYDFAPFDDTTYLVEIIYPDNRIVLDYGKEEKLVLLGTVSNNDGSIGTAHDAVLFGEWYGPIVDSFIQYDTLASALLAEPRKNAEGIVIRDTNTNAMIKCKQEDYVRLHKLVFGLSEKAVWEHLSTHNGDITGMLEGLPDEFHGWVNEKADELLRLYRMVEYGATSTFNAMSEYITLGRKAFAEKAEQMGALRPFLFALLDSKDISPMIWKSLKPKGDTKLIERTEDVA